MASTAPDSLSGAGPAPPESNALARSYQPRRMRAAVISIAWNLVWLSAFLGSDAPEQLAEVLPRTALWVAPAYLAILFGLYALVNLPLELWYGYLQERQFGLVKRGLRVWARDWIVGNAQHGTMFLLGAWGILALQHLWGAHWLLLTSGAMLVVFLATTWFGAELIPPGLFQFGRPDSLSGRRLQRLVGPQHELPAVVLFTWADMRDFSGGLVGLGRRQMLLISQAALELGSDAMLRFVLLHELGHRRYHHLLLSTLAAWGYATAGLVFCDAIIIRLAMIELGSAIYIPWLALFFTTWMILGQPALAYIGRRLEYQADRFYLDHGGSLEEMRQALGELSHRDLARTDTTRRRQSLIEAVPIVARRIRAAEMHLAGRAD